MNVTPEQLKHRQSLPLHLKVKETQNRIGEWYEAWDGDVYVSFSGGKDSTVLLHIARSIIPNTRGMFVDTGLEWPEVRDFVKGVDNVDWVKPKKSFHRVIEEYGYPVVSKDCSQKLTEIRTTKSYKLLHKRLCGDDKGNGKLPEKWKFLIDAPFKISHKCCDIMKKNPAKRYEKERGLMPIVGTMATDSSLRTSSYLRNGCNSFDTKRPRSTPMGFWTEADVWDYIHLHNLEYADIYNSGLERTGCMFCMFGLHMEKGENKRFDIMRQRHPKLYDYCMDKLGLREVIQYVNRGGKDHTNTAEE